jgi:indole-3-glycerol phosphate synthase/phosphoribosylanthranilate isomerase
LDSDTGNASDPGRDISPEKEEKGSILDKIVRRRRERLRDTDRGHAQGFELSPRRATPPVPFPESPFLLCEVKRRSPSVGLISALPDPAVQVDRYRDAGIGAISVLTEEEFFGGSLRDLIDLKERHPELFILRKDFLLDPEDIEVSHRAGADGILLIAAVLDRSRLEELYRLAVSRGMSVLVEIHNREEIEKIRSLRPDTVGINARDLRNFSIDLLTPVGLSGFLNWNPRKIFESGIRSEEDAALAFSSGFDGALVGEAVMRDPGLLPRLQKARRYYPGAGIPDSRVPGIPDSFWISLYRRGMPAALRNGGNGTPLRPLVKICGLTNEEDAALAEELGADILGFVLAPSPRRADPGLIRRLGRTRARKVGVLVSDPVASVLPPEIDALFREGALDAIQFHGEEKPENCFDMAFPYYKALRIRDKKSVNLLKKYRSPRVLADAFTPDRYGGTGRSISPELVEQLRRQGPLWLAGGIGPDNVRRIILDHEPELIDASSRLESEPGKKDPEKLRKFFEEISAAMQEKTENMPDGTEQTAVKGSTKG